MIPKGGTGKRIRNCLGKMRIYWDQNGVIKTYPLGRGFLLISFGRQACTGVGLAALALRSGAPVLPGLWRAEIGNEIQVNPETLVEISRTGNYEAESPGEIPSVSPKVVEEIVREYPDQWFLDPTSGGRQRPARSGWIDFACYLLPEVKHPVILMNTDAQNPPSYTITMKSNVLSMRGIPED